VWGGGWHHPRTLGPWRWWGVVVVAVRANVGPFPARPNLGWGPNLGQKSDQSQRPTPWSKWVKPCIWGVNMFPWVSLVCFISLKSISMVTIGGVVQVAHRALTALPQPDEAPGQQITITCDHANEIQRSKASQAPHSPIRSAPHEWYESF
jgi:hypothetical protein